MIEGILITKRDQISDDRGKIMHMVRNDDKIFKKFGEIYFSCIYPHKIKAWHMHKKMTLNYALVYGEIKLVLYDDRKSSSTYKKTQEIILSKENYCLVTVPPLIWNGFKSLSSENSILANCSDIPHDPKEIERKSFDDLNIPYQWSE
jgi:dTDP-4-dehydrorhamnose 3,5-epimerase